MIICSPQLGLAPNSTLGGEVFDRQILLGLAKKGIKIEIITVKDKPHDKNVRNWHFSYIPIAHFPAVLGNILFLPQLFRVYKNTKFSILRIHQPQFLGLGALIFKIINPKVKTVATFHQFKETNFIFLSSIVNKSWDFIITDSYSVKRKIVEAHNIKPSKIEVVHNGVPNYLKPAKKDKSLLKKLDLENKIVLLFMGLLDNRKNPLFLLDVLTNLAKTGSDLVIIFWGKGPLESAILRKAKKLGLSKNIRIQKPIFGSEKNKIHNLADIFVHPATDEGFALAPLESMACAKPIVMTDGYSAREAIEDGVNGFLCNSNDSIDWSKRLNELIHDSRLRNKMGRASLSKVRKEFLWEIAVEKHIQSFKLLFK